MSKERELLKECRLMLDNPINGTAGRNLQIKITDLLAQPEKTEQELIQDIISDIEYLITAFEKLQKDAKELLAHPEMNTITVSLEQVEAYIKNLGMDYDEWWMPEYDLFSVGLLDFLKGVDGDFGNAAKEILKLHVLELDRLKYKRR